MEVDPSGEYGHYMDLIGAGTIKKVYRTFDNKKGIGVTWNQVCLQYFMDDLNAINYFYSEMELLHLLRQKKITFY